MKDSDVMGRLGRSVIHVNVSPVEFEGSKLMFTQSRFGVANPSEQSQQNHSSS